jgi:Rrf2 family iron-sulfur cluster assembly transcriptional regulator
MQVTRASEYGMLGLIALGRRPLGEVVMVDVLAREEGIPPTFLGKIFQSLNKAGIVRSARGTGGGFALARSADEVSVLEVIEAVEGPIAFQRCLEPEADCTHMGGCALCGLFSEAQDRVKDVFGRTTVADLSQRHTSFVEHQAARGGHGPKHPRAADKSIQLEPISQIPELKTPI